MSAEAMVENQLVQDASTVWVLRDHQRFGYSDGQESERYLDMVLRKATDLSSGSTELEGYIKDWPSEYHLSTKRSQLLSGFSFERSARVLEVGCGCGAITRFLGESFDSVVSIEGSLNRARLARLRTRDLEHVSIVCAPFQEIRFAEKFDIIVCVGVYEYSGSFVNGADPYEAVLRYFRDMLAPDGMVIIAIENQFGLKYFASSREDHLGTMFEGIEGYHARPEKVRTFGRMELEAKLKRHFPVVQFYYPYPDYKLADCVVDEGFLESGAAGELVSQMRPRDYLGTRAPLWDEAAAVLELSRNGALPFFANSFVALAGKGTTLRASFDQTALYYSSARKAEFRTCTKVAKGEDGRLVASKRPRDGRDRVTSGALTLRAVESPWISSPSLHTILYLRAKEQGASLDAVFEPAKAWVEFLTAAATRRDGTAWLSGDHIDCIWPNVYPTDMVLTIIDKEWVWKEPISLPVIVARAIYTFLVRVTDAPGMAPPLRRRGGGALIRAIGASIGVEITERDLKDFAALEIQLQSLVGGTPPSRRQSAIMWWYLRDRQSLALMRAGRSGLRRLRSRLTARLGRR